MQDSTQYIELEQALRERHAALRAEIETRLLETQDARFQDVAHRVQDAGEASVHDLIKGLEFDRIDTESRELEAVEHALSKFDNGRYGLCEDCGRPIQLGRLRAEPTATRCLEHQQKHEQEFGTEPEPSL